MKLIKKLKEKKKGFTLIELIVVIAIIGILAAILLPRFGNFTDDARQSAFESSVRNVSTSVTAEYAINGLTSMDDITEVQTIATEYGLTVTTGTFTAATAANGPSYTITDTVYSCAVDNEGDLGTITTN